ncbi:MAG: dihydrodipicolinate synthase family protein [Candidatus Competibacteraceae bacterium]|nr:dihydrodipicolinate synthase family protein [Candidatus Competibacteraceae bacterium]
MKITRLIEGVVPVLQTPFREDRSVDTAAITRHIAFLAGTGIGGYWVLGTGSEDMNLTFAKRLAVARAATEANAGKLPLVLGAGFFCMEDSLAFMKETAGLEFDAYHVMPYHPLLSLDRLDWYYRRLADAATKPLWLYTSANWARPITPAFVAKLKDHPNITGIKYSTSNAPDQLKVIGLAEPGFQVMTAVVRQFFACLSMGAKSGTTSTAGALPEPIVDIFRRFAAGNLDEALALQRHFVRFLDALPNTSKADNFLTGAEEKYILKRRGICELFMTDYYRDLNSDEQRQVDRALEQFQMLPYVPLQFSNV